MKMTERLWLTDGGKVVKDGHKDAAFLLCAPGDEMSDERAKKLGIKQGQKPANKSMGKSNNK